VGKGRAKRPKPAVYSANEAADLTQKLLRVYAAGPEFQGELRHFAERNEQVIRRLTEVEENSADLSALGKLASWREFWPLIEEYWTDTKRFTSEWGLDLLPDQLGIDSLHRFCISRFKTGLNFDDLPRAVTEIDDFNRAVSEEFGQPGMRLFGEIQFRGEWAASTETRTQARARLLAEFIERMDGELERVVEEYEQVGYAFRDTEPDLMEHLHWVYRRLAYRDSTDVIAKQVAFRSRRTIEKATNRLAKRLALKYPRATRAMRLH
jgi:hypothetical protein